MSDHHGIFSQFFLDPEVICSLHTMFINAPTKDFTLENNAIPIYDIAFEHLRTSPSHIMKLIYR